MIPDPLNNPTNPIQVINSNMPLNADNQSNLNIDAKSEIIHCDKAPNLVIKSFETNNKTMENQQKESIQTKNNIAEQVPSLRNNSNSQIPHSTEEKALIKENNSTLPQDEEVTEENNNRVTFDTSKWESNFSSSEEALSAFNREGFAAGLLFKIESEKYKLIEWKYKDKLKSANLLYTLSLYCFEHKRRLKYVDDNKKTSRTKITQLLGYKAHSDGKTSGSF